MCKWSMQQLWNGKHAHIQVHLDKPDMVGSPKFVRFTKNPVYKDTSLCEVLIRWPEIVGFIENPVYRGVPVQVCVCAKVHVRAAVRRGGNFFEGVPPAGVSPGERRGGGGGG